MRSNQPLGARARGTPPPAGRGGGRLLPLRRVGRRHFRDTTEAFPRRRRSDLRRGRRRRRRRRRRRHRRRGRRVAAGQRRDVRPSAGDPLLSAAAAALLLAQGVGALLLLPVAGGAGVDAAAAAAAVVVPPLAGRAPSLPAPARPLRHPHAADGARRAGAVGAARRPRLAAREVRARAVADGRLRRLKAQPEGGAVRGARLLLARALDRLLPAAAAAAGAARAHSRPQGGRTSH